MNELLLVCLSLSVSGSLLALLLFALQPLAKKRLSRSWQYYVWLIVLLRFLLPFAPPLSLVGELSQALGARAGVAEAQFSRTDTVQIDAHGRQLPASAESLAAPSADGWKPDLPPEGKAPDANGWPVVLDYAWVAWLDTALVLIGYKAAAYRSFVRFVKAGAREVAEGGLANLYLDELALLGIRRRIPLYINDLIGTPMLVGLFRPAVILPPLNASEAELRQILRHELVHLKRLDFLYKWLVQVTLCLHWFNPLVYGIARRINRCCELSCDEAVIRGLDEEHRLLYGDALLATLRAQGGYSGAVLSITMSEDAGTVMERLGAICGYRRNSPLSRAAAAGLTLCLLCGAVFAGAYPSASAGMQIPQAGQTPGATGQQGGVWADPPPALGEVSGGETDSGFYTLVEREYTLDQLRQLNISGVVVEAVTEHVSIATGGQTLQLRYYQADSQEYTLQNEPDRGGTIEELCLRRAAPRRRDEPERTIQVTIPQGVSFSVVGASSQRGSIAVDNAICRSLLLDTQNGTIAVSGGGVEDSIIASTTTGSMEYDRVALDGSTLSMETVSGSALVRLPNPADHYKIDIDTWDSAHIFINGRLYTGGEYTVNNRAAGGSIDFSSRNGSLVVQD